MTADEQGIGWHIPTIQSILRHQNSLTTSRYLRKLGNTRNVLEEVFVIKAFEKSKTPEGRSAFGG